MAYKKNYRRKRYQPKGRARWSKAGASAGSMAYSAYRLASKLAKVVNVETKYHDTTYGSSTSWTGLLYTVANVPQGDTDTSRDGDSIKCQNLDMRYLIDSSSVSPAVVRIMVIEDKQNKLSTPADLLTTTGVLQAVLSDKKHDRRFQSKVLYDQCHVVSPNSSNDLVYRRVKLALGHHTQFDAGSTTINTGDYKVLVISNRGTNLPFVSLDTRLTYTDN